MRKKIEAGVVSVIITSYRLGKYLWETIHSVEEQTYKKLELIVVDDGSEDEKTRDVLAKIEKERKYQVIRIKNSGVSEARNTGVSVSNGEYLMFLDGDDKIAPTYIEKCVAVMEEDADIGLVYSLSRLFGDANRIRPLDSPNYSRLLVYNNFFYVTCLLKKELFYKAGQFNLNMRKGLEDWEFFIRYCHKGMKVCRINNILFYYRIRKQSRTKKVNGSVKATLDVRLETLRNNEEIYIQYPKSLKQFKLTIEEKNSLKTNIKKCFYWFKLLYALTFRRDKVERFVM